MVHNPSNLYSGGQGIFNSMPYVKMTLDQEAKRLAKDEALDKYYQNLPNTVNPAGLRTQDVEGFNTRLGKINDYWNQNKAAIKNPRLDNGKSQHEYQSMFTGAKTYVNTSKGEELKKQPIVKLIANPNTRQMVMDEDMRRVALHDKSLDDPERVSFDFSTFDLNPKELTPPQIETYRKSLTAGFPPSQKEDREPIFDPQRLTVTRRYKKEYSPEQLRLMADKDLVNSQTDRQIAYNAKRTWDILKDNPEQFNKYNEIFKGIYKKDIESPEELHAAVMVGNSLGESVNEETKLDKVAFANLMQKYKQQNIAANRVAQNSQSSQGNLFDRVGETEPVYINLGGGGLFGLGKGKKTGTIYKGIVYDETGNPMKDGDISIPTKNLPTDLVTVFKKNNILPSDGDKYRVENGVIVNVKNKMGVTDRNALETYQLTFNKEPQKGLQPNFGRTTQPTLPPKQKGNNNQQKVVPKTADNL